jgi:CHASE3 domain sensor protein
MLISAVVVPLVLMIGLSGVLLWQIRHLINESQWVDHTDRVIGQANDIRKLLSDMESGERGYLLTGNPQFLESYTDALPEIDPSFERLNSLVADNPAQVRRLNEIRPLSLRWRSGLRQQGRRQKAYGRHARQVRSLRERRRVPS